MTTLADIIAKIEGYHPGADIRLIEDAYAYAVSQHDGQSRRSGAAYVTHPISVAAIITELRLDAASVAAALLHDVVEDTEAERADIAQRFGEDVAFLVDGVTKLGRINFSSKEDQQAESFRKMLVAMARDIRVLLVKLADRLDNMRTLEFMKPASRVRIASETQDIYAPLAGRLGIHWLKAELEDLSFQHLHPESYEELLTQSRKRAKDADRYIKSVSEEMAEMLRENGLGCSVNGRMKHFASIFNKMKRTGCAFEQVQDFIAFRVMVEDITDCYAALGVIHSRWTPIPGRFKDFVALPKPNMYQSLHTTVIGPSQRRIEVQIRTHTMHRTAEYGVAAHWEYKQGTVAQRDNERFAWLRKLVESQQEVADPSEFIETVRGDLFQDEVYVFTPRGDVKTFPRGATPIDFAYAIHSEVGDHCHGARVNGSLVPLRSLLHNGDVVEVVTSAQQRPSKDWLESAVTGRARSKIRAYLREEERKHSLKLGRELLERELRRHGYSLNKLTKSDNLTEIFEHYQVHSLDDLYAHIGYGRITAESVVAQLQGDDPKARNDLKRGLLERAVDRVTPNKGIVIQGHSDILVRYARCCSPVPGDSVVGFITRGRGVTIHRRTCPHALELDPVRRIDVTWSAEPSLRLPVIVQVVSLDRPGILAKMSTAFGSAGFNIREASCRVDREGRAFNDFHVEVNDLSHLRTLIRHLHLIDGVLDVRRLGEQSAGPAHFASEAPAAPH